MVGFRKFIEYVTLLREVEAVDMWCDSGEPIQPTKTCNFDSFHRIKNGKKITLPTGATGVHGEVRISLRNVWWIVYRSQWIAMRPSHVPISMCCLHIAKVISFKSQIESEKSTRECCLRIFFCFLLKRKWHCYSSESWKCRYEWAKGKCRYRLGFLFQGWMRQMTSKQLNIECLWLRMMRLMKTVHLQCTWLLRLRTSYKASWNFLTNTRFVLVDQKLEIIKNPFCVNSVFNGSC